MDKIKESVRNNSVVLFFSGLFLLLVLRYLSTTYISTDSFEFLRTYKFTGSDSFDWIANGVRMFSNDSLTFRNPGLPFMVNVLHYTNLLFLLPLFNYISLLVTSVFVFKSINLFKISKWIPYFVTVLIFVNFSIVMGAGYILADYYAVMFITIAAYMLLKSRIYLSLVALAVSILFQNLGIFLIPIWLLFHYRKSIYPANFKKIDYKNVLIELLKIGICLVPGGIWYLYKLLVFGNPLYTKLDYFSLIKPGVNSLLYYLLNVYTFFGFGVILLALYILWNIRKYIADWRYAFLLSITAFNMVFWFLIYDWEDRRFLIYFAPWVFIFIGIVLNEIMPKMNWKLLIVIIIFYSTTLPLSSFFSGYEVPIIGGKYLEIRNMPDESSADVLSVDRPNESALGRHLLPHYFLNEDAINYYQNSNSTWFHFYDVYTEHYADINPEEICLDKTWNPKQYNIESLGLIKFNWDIDEINYYRDDCGDLIL